MMMQLYCNNYSQQEEVRRYDSNQGQEDVVVLEHAHIMFSILPTEIEEQGDSIRECDP